MGMFPVVLMDKLTEMDLLGCLTAIGENGMPPLLCSILSDQGFGVRCPALTLCFLSGLL